MGMRFLFDAHQIADGFQLDFGLMYQVSCCLLFAFILAWLLEDTNLADITYYFITL